MTSHPLVPMMIAAALTVTATLHSQSHDRLTYDQFMKIESTERRATFPRLTAENKAELKRTHAQRWLAANRRDLSQRQIAAVDEAIAFVTPKLYSGAGDGDTLELERAIKNKLVCALGREKAAEAFALYSDRDPTSQKLPDGAVDRWLTWFSACTSR